jgi:hypothetical protein
MTKAICSRARHSLRSNMLRDLVVTVRCYKQAKARILSKQAAGLAGGEKRCLLTMHRKASACQQAQHDEQLRSKSHPVCGWQPTFNAHTGTETGVKMHDTSQAAQLAAV